VLQAAFAAFAAEGLSVPVHEIARRAGVGTGTVSRHFPTKEALFEAVFMSRAERLAGMARMLKGAADAGDAFFDFFGAIVASDRRRGDVGGGVRVGGAWLAGGDGRG
jgi:AcrR family transcriptional regulator